MNQLDWKSAVITLVLTILVLKYFVNVPKDHQAF